jgi:hypothetical protein
VVVLEVALAVVFAVVLDDYVLLADDVALASVEFKVSVLLSLDIAAEPSSAEELEVFAWA